MVQGLPVEPQYEAPPLSVPKPALRDLYPGQEVFACSDVAGLQAHLARSRRRIQELEREAQRHSFRNGLLALGRGLFGRWRRAA
jgi:hypothetical protein